MYKIGKILLLINILQLCSNDNIPSVCMLLSNCQQTRSVEMAEKRKTADIRSFFNAPKRQVSRSLHFDKDIYKKEMKCL